MNTERREPEDGRRALEGLTVEEWERAQWRVDIGEAWGPPDAVDGDQLDDEAAIEGEIVPAPGRWSRIIAKLTDEFISESVATPWRQVADNVFVAPVGTPMPTTLDLGDVAAMPFGTPAPPGSLIRTSLVNGSPALHIGERPVAWFENWLREQDGRMQS